MLPVCLYFQVHQPYRLARYDYFDVGREHRYFDDAGNAALLRRVAARCYVPATAMLRRLLTRYAGFRVSFSLSGCLIEQLRESAPEVLAAFRAIADTGRAEFLAETSHHSLAWLASREEFSEQVRIHRRAIEDAVGFSPRVFRNTELIYSDGLAVFLEERSYAGVLADGVPQLLAARAPHFLYRASTPRGLPLLLRDARLSDDIAFRFSNRTWSEHPLTAEKYGRWIGALSGDVLSIFMDFETFGEHQWADTGIFQFFEAWVDFHIASGGGFLTPSEAIAALPLRDVLSAPRLLSWADEARDLSAWQGNELQRDALRRLFALEKPIRESGSPDLERDFRRLTTSDHYYYMATKPSADGDVHSYFSPFETPFDAYMRFVHVVSDLEARLPRSPLRPRPTSVSRADVSTHG